MDRKESAVNPSRTYDSAKRAEQARRTRRTVLETAQELFLRDGFATTTMPAIAGVAQVSVETVYKAFGSKTGLVRAICDNALAGNEPVPAEIRSDDLQRRETDPREIIRGWGRLAAEVAPRVQPILLLLRAAAPTDHDLAALLADIDDRRLARMTSNARTLERGGHLAPGVTVDYAADVMWTLSSAETYDLLVNRRGWPPDRYGAFVSGAMTSLLLP